MHYSLAANFNPAIAIAVAERESNLNNEAIGALGEVGLFQIRPEFVSISNKDLKNIDINIKTGILLLKEAKEKCIHKKNNEWLVCFNMGVTKGNTIKHPELNRYVIEVNNLIKERENVRTKESNTYQVYTSGRWYIVQ